MRSNSLESAAPPRQPPVDAALLTVTDAASTLRVGRTTIYTLISRGDLDALKIGSATRITRASVARLIQRAPAPAMATNKTEQR